MSQVDNDGMEHPVAFFSRKLLTRNAIRLYVKGIFGSEAWGGSRPNLSFGLPLRDRDRSSSFGVARQSQREQHASGSLEFLQPYDYTVHLLARGDQREC